MSYYSDLEFHMQRAQALLRVTQNGFLDECSEEIVLSREGAAAAYQPVISEWFCISGYRMKSSEKETREAIRRAIREWIRGIGEMNSDRAFIAEHLGDDIRFWFGGGNSNSFTTQLPDCRVESNGAKGWIPQKSMLNWNAAVTGTIDMEDFCRLFAADAGLSDCYIALVICQEPEDNLRDLYDRINLEIEQLVPFETISIRSGKREEKRPVKEVVTTLTELRKEREWLNDSIPKGMCRTCIRVGAATKEACDRVIGLLKSCRKKDNSSRRVEPLRAFRLIIPENNLSAEERRKEAMAVPAVIFRMEANGNNGRERRMAGPVSNLVMSLKEKLESGKDTGKPDNRMQESAVHLLSLQDIEETISLCMLPMTSCQGFYVVNLHTDENSMEAFPLCPLPHVEQGEPVIRLGTIVESAGGSSPLVLSLNILLRRHALICGLTGSGKTTTIQHILMQAWKCGIPFCVIEPAKKEYAAMAGRIPEMRIYGSGSDGLPLMFNPLEPEDGVLIENHVGTVARLLMLSTGAEHPIPEAMQGLLQQCYRRFGWEYGETAYQDPDRPYPVFQDVLYELDSYIADNACYGPEVRQNLYGALQLRIRTMSQGALGELTGHRHGLMARDLLERPVVIELQDFAPSDVEFLMGMLMFRFQCWLRGRSASGLRRLIVVEEAHNLYRKSSTANQQEDLRTANNIAMDNMLAEVRASGTGILLCDQHPSIMSSAVCSGTAVHIVFSLTTAGREGDLTIFQNSDGLTEMQTKKIRGFRPGECLVSVMGGEIADGSRGTGTGLWHIRADRGIHAETVRNPACVMCSSRTGCRRDNIRRLLDNVDRDLIRYSIARIQAHPYNGCEVDRVMSGLLSEMHLPIARGSKLCYLGELLAEDGQGRLVVRHYMKFLEQSG